MLIEYADQVIEVKSDGLFYWADKQSETLQGIKGLIDKETMQTVKCKALWLQGDIKPEIVEVRGTGSFNIVWVETSKGLRKTFLDCLYACTPGNETLLLQIHKLWDEEKNIIDKRWELVKKLEKLNLS